MDEYSRSGLAPPMGAGSTGRRALTVSKHSSTTVPIRDLIAGRTYPMPVAAHVAFSDYCRARVAAGLPVAPVVLLPGTDDAPTVELPIIRARVATSVMPAVRS
jgi:hypothetical protein